MLRHRVERAWHCWRATARAQQGRDAQPSTAALSHGTRRCTPSRGEAGYRRYYRAGRRRAQRLESSDDRCRRGAGVSSTRLRGRTPHPCRRNALLWRSRRARLGNRTLARDVAEALSQNLCPIIVPCHRILAAGGKPGGFSAPGGVATKLRLLTIEGAQPEGPMLFDRLPLAAPRTRR